MRSVTYTTYPGVPKVSYLFLAVTKAEIKDLIRLRLFL